MTFQKNTIVVAFIADGVIVIILKILCKEIVVFCLFLPYFVVLGGNYDCVMCIHYLCYPTAFHYISYGRLSYVKATMIHNVAENI